MSFYAVDPIFREFYNYLGGEAVLGEAISDIFKEDGKQFQYTLSGLMIYDQQAPVNSRFKLGPLGRRLGLGGPTSPDVEVAEPFRLLYDKLSTFAGQSLTGLVYDRDQDRYEQYFENIGFYQAHGFSGETRLLPYGAWSCNADCRSTQPRNSILESSSPTTASRADIPTITSTFRYEWSLLVQESFPLVSPVDVQQIEVELKKNGVPLNGEILDLTLHMPSGAQKFTTFPPTDRDGKTRLSIQPFGASSGTLVPYNVCITSQSGDAFCVQGSYLIWAEP